MLGVLWRARRWRLLQNLIDHLPPDSHYAEAMLNDSEYAAAIIAAGLPEPAERISQWSPVREALAQVIDALHIQTQTLVAVMGGTPRTVRAVDRPVTAIERAAGDDKRRRYEQLLAQILGPRR